MHIKKIHADYLRSILFGLQDGLVSTTGVVAGIATGIQDKQIIVLAAFVAVTVEATSMAAGQYSSEKAVHQMDKTNSHTDSLILGAILMFGSYYLAGLVPIIPTILLPIEVSQFVSIPASFIALFIVGFIKGKVVKHHALRSAVEMFIIGGIATLLGLIVGHFFRV